MAKTKSLVKVLNDIYKSSSNLVIVKADAQKNYAPFGIDIKGPLVCVGLLNKIFTDWDLDKGFCVFNRNTEAKFYNDSIKFEAVKYSQILEIRDLNFKILYKRDK